MGLQVCELSACEFIYQRQRMAVRTALGKKIGVVIYSNEAYQDVHDQRPIEVHVGIQQRTQEKQTIKLHLLYRILIKSSKSWKAPGVAIRIRKRYQPGEIACRNLWK